MKNITRYNVAFNTIDTVSIFDSEITRWFDENGFDVEKDIIKMNTVVPDSKNADVERDRVSMLVTHYAADGFNFNGITYVPMFAAAGDVRKGTSTWMNKKVAASFWKWAMVGVSLPQISGKITMAKYMAYIGLLASASKRFTEAFGKKVDIRRVVIVKDAYVEVVSNCDFVNASGAIDLKVGHVVEINAFDGFGIHRKEITNGESLSTRIGPGCKAFSQAVDFNKLPGNTIVDLWGREVNIEDVDFIMCESCFKYKSLFSSWEEYCDAYEKYGHHACACVREHAPRVHGMPYQQGQTLLGDDEDVEIFANHALSSVSKYEDQNEAVNLLSGFHRVAAKLYPALMAESHTARTMQEKYTSKRNDMLGGRIPELGYNAFLAPDLVAFVQHIFGQEITGSLKAGECSCAVAKYGPVDVTRNPHLDNAHVVLKNVRNMDYVGSTPTMFINIFDMTTIRLRADYDGDHVWYSQDSDLLKLIEKTENILGNLPIDWVAPGAKKGTINKAAVAAFVSSLLKGSEIGLYADALTKMWNNGYNRDVCDWLTYAGNVLIDAAKHGGTKITKPDAVKALDGESLPEFCRYAKADKEHPADSGYWDEPKKSGAPRTAYTGSFLDRYSRKIKEIVPEILTVKGSDEMVFDVVEMLINPERKIGKLSGLSKRAKSFDIETGKYEDGGLFQMIAFRHAEEWKKVLLIDDNVKMIHKEWEEAKAAEARKEMIDWARAQYEGNEAVAKLSDDQIFEGIYDIVTRNVFSLKNTTEGYDTVVKSAYWRIFGQKAVEVLENNLDVKGLDVIENFDEDIDDIDC